MEAVESELKRVKNNRSLKFSLIEGQIEINIEVAIEVSKGLVIEK